MDPEQKEEESRCQVHLPALGGGHEMLPAEDAASAARCAVKILRTSVGRAPHASAAFSELRTPYLERMHSAASIVSCEPLATFLWVKMEQETRTRREQKTRDEKGEESFELSMGRFYHILTWERSAARNSPSCSSVIGIVCSLQPALILSRSIRPCT